MRPTFKSHHSGMETTLITLVPGRARGTLNRTIVGWKLGAPPNGTVMIGPLNRTIVGWKHVVSDWLVVEVKL